MKLGIGIVNTNQRKEVLRLMRSINEQDVEKIEVYLLDNNCVLEERLEKDLRRFSVPVRYTASEEKLTWASAGNVLWRQMKLGGCHLFWFIGNDLELTEGAIEKVVEWFSNIRSEAWIVGNSFRIGTRGRFVWGMWVRNSANNRGESFDWISKDNLILNLKAINLLRGFTEGIYYGFEGVELCLRGTSLGCQIGWIENNLTRGFENKKKSSALSEYFISRNQLILVKNYSQGGKRLKISVLGIILTLRAFLRWFLGKIGLKELKMVLAGVSDGWEIGFER